MPTPRRVPDIYPTIYDAYAACADGDTIDLSPGTYHVGMENGGVWSMRFNKNINVRGLGATPAEVVLYGKYGVIGISANITADMHFENLTLSLTSGGDIIQYENGIVPSGSMYLNKCVTSGSHTLWQTISSNASFSYNLYLVNCDLSMGSLYISPGSPNFKMYWLACAGTVVPNNAEGGAPLTEDNLGTIDIQPVGTVGYGSAYGGPLDLNALDYRIAGTVAIDNASPADTHISLFKADVSNGIAQSAFLTTTPDATTGAWEFNYLPSDVSYYVAVVPPAGYRPELIGPYDPENT